MDIEGLSRGQTNMLERLIGDLLDQGVTDEDELYRAAVLALRLQPVVEQVRREMN